MRAVDTNLLVRLAVRDDPRQVKAAEAFIAGGAWVSQLVLLEFGWVLASVYELGSKDVAKAIEILLSHAQLVIEGRDTVDAALAQFRECPTIGFSDCLVLEVARRSGHLPLGTFDRDLGRLEGAEHLGRAGVRTRPGRGTSS